MIFYGSGERIVLSEDRTRPLTLVIQNKKDDSITRYFIIFSIQKSQEISWFLSKKVEKSKNMKKKILDIRYKSIRLGNSMYSKI